MKFKLKKVDVRESVILVTKLSFFAGLVAGIVYSVGGLFVDIAVTLGWIAPSLQTSPGLSYGTILAFGALIGMPLYASVIGFVVGLVGAWCNNLVVNWLIE